MRIGVVACGYADGYPRHAPTGTPVLVDGRAHAHASGACRWTCCAWTSPPCPARGSARAVVLWGEGLPVDEVAAAAGTVGYELLCALAPRVPVSRVSCEARRPRTVIAEA